MRRPWAKRAREPEFDVGVEPFLRQLRAPQPGYSDRLWEQLAQARAVGGELVLVNADDLAVLLTLFSAAAQAASDLRPRRDQRSVEDVEPERDYSRYE